MAKTVERESVVGDVLREPSIPDILRHRRSDGEFLGFLRRSGWSGELPYYRFKCPVHGMVENYPQGYHELLLCPHCDD